MRHLVPHMLDQWSHGSSPFHRFDARLKLAGLLLALFGISLSPPTVLVFAAALLLVGAWISRLPLSGLLNRAAFVLPFSATIALAAWLSGDSTRAATLLTKSYLSAFAALLFAATTPLPTIAAALRSWHAPPALVSIIQFVYRYLFVVAEEAATMRAAARARGGFRFTAAAGAVGVLFARSWQRAEAVHRAMLARGHGGSA